MKKITKKTTRAVNKRSATVFRVFTIFPRLFDSYLGESLLRRAAEQGILEVTLHDIRAYAENRHAKVDSRPFGGGPGMVLEVGPIFRAVTAAARASRVPASKRRVILLSPRGKPFTAAVARKLAEDYRELFFICGRYEGVDERVAKHVADASYSVGPYVLNGGEVGAMAMIEAVSRFLPGFLGKKESLEEIAGSHAAYARPPEFAPDAKGLRALRRKNLPKRWIVPTVLRSGDHEAIRRFRGRTPSR